MSLFRDNAPTGVRVNTRIAGKEAPFTGPAWPVMAAALAAALLFQIELAHYLTFRGAQPSLVLVLVAWYALHADWRRAAIFGLISGACEDALSAQTGASWTIATMLSAGIAGYAARWFFADSIPIAAIVAFFCTLLRQMFFWVSMAVTMQYPPGYAAVHFHEAAWASLMNAVLICALVLALRRFGVHRTA